MTTSYLEGFLDSTTIEALKQADGCTNSRVGGYPARHPLTGTMWYDSVRGSIHDFGNGKPYHLREDQHILPVQVLFDATGSLPLPKLYRSEEMTPALETALASIKAYREVNDPLAKFVLN